MSKKKLFLILFYVTLSLSAFSLTKIKFENGVKLSFEAMEDLSVRFEATGKNPSSPMKMRTQTAARDESINTIKTASSAANLMCFFCFIISRFHRL